MSSLWRQDRSPFWTGCITVVTGQARQRLKKSTATAERKLAQRIADELEEAGHGRRSSQQVLAFLDTITDLHTRRVVRRSFDDVLRMSTGRGLATKTTRGYMEEWLTRVRGEVSPASYAKYDQTTRLFLESLGGLADQDMASVRRDDISRFRDAQAKRVSAATVNGLMKVLRVAFAAAEADGVVPKNEARLVKKLKADEDAVARRAFTVKELGLILRACKPEWRSLVLFGFYSGARLGDIAMLTWQNIDLESKELRFVMRKTGRPVVVPLATPLAEHVLSLPAGDDPKQPLHPHAYAVMTSTKRRKPGNGPRVGNVGRLSNEFRAILETAGLAKPRVPVDEGDEKPKDGVKPKAPRKGERRESSDVVFHSLRHTAVSLLKNAGVSDAVARDLVGHESAEINAHYTHIEDAPKREAVNKLPDLRRAGTE